MGILRTGFGRTLMAGAAIAALQTTAIAQDDASGDLELEEIIVSATKRDELLKEVNMAVTALQTEDLFERQNLNLLDISSQVPGLEVQPSNRGVNRLIIRGQNSGGSGASVAVLVDDVPFSFASALSNGAVLTAEIDPYDLAQIEVLRGPQGTLYGATAQGGLLKYVTAKPDTSDTYGSIEGGTQHIKDGDLGFNARGFANIAVNEKLAVRVSGFYEDVAGWIDNPSVGDEDYNTAEKYGGRVSVMFEPTDNFSVLASGFYQKLEANGQASVNVEGSPTGAVTATQFDFVNGLSNNELSTTRGDIETFYSYLKLSLDLDFATVRSITSYGEITSDSSSDISGGPTGAPAPFDTFGGLIGFSFFGQPVGIDFVDNSGLEKFNQEVQLISAEGSEVGGMRLDWQLGGFYTRENTALGQTAQAFDPASGTPLDIDASIFGSSVLLDVTSPGKYEEISGYGEFSLYLTDDFDISVGGRFTSVDQSVAPLFDGLQLGLAAPLASQVTESSETAFTYSIAPRYRFSEDTILYGRIATGFRPGGPQTLLAFVPVASDLPLEYSRDKTVNYEIGLRTALLDKALTIDIAAFLIDWTDIQVQTSFFSEETSISYNVTANAGQAQTKGIEWSISYSPFEGLTISDVGAYTDATLSDDAPALNGLEGDRLAFIPEISNTLNVDYTWDLDDGREMFIGGTWLHTGNRVTNFSVNPFVTPNVNLGSYDQFNVQAGLRGDGYFVQLFARNLTNSQALLGYVNAGAPGGLGSAQILQPRTIGIRLGFDY